MYFQNLYTLKRKLGAGTAAIGSWGIDGWDRLGIGDLWENVFLKKIIRIGFRPH